jgi:glucans biosynthesis protein C
MASPAPREHGLDALRVAAFALLIIYHSGLGYTTKWWIVKNPDQSAGLEHVMVFFHGWRLPLLFFISGAGAAFALRRRTLGQFAGERIVRLFVPLVFTMLVLVPPQIYLDRVQRGAHYESYLAFHRTVLDLVPYDDGGALSWHHLWFVAYVLVFALASLPLFALLRRPGGVWAVGELAGLLERWPLALYLVPLPGVAAAYLMLPRWPANYVLLDDWANLAITWLFFFWGFVFASERRLLDVVTRRRRELLAAAVAVTAAFYVVRFRGSAPYLVSNAVQGYFAMMWMLAFVGFARAWNPPSTPFLRYATEAVYPFYILHQTITVVLVYELAPVSLGIAPKIAIVAAGTFLGSWLGYELVRRVAPLRPLFGLKLRARGADPGTTR